MIPNFKMGYYHQKDYFERPCNGQINDKFIKKPVKESMDGFEYTSLFASKTYSVLSYIVGGFVGSKSQINNKHNLSYDLSAAIVNLLKPCKYERDKVMRRNNENFYNSVPKLSTEAYDKYIVKSSQKEEKMVDLEVTWLGALPLLEENFLVFNGPCYNSSKTKDSINCDESKMCSDIQSTMTKSQSEEYLLNSVDVTDRVPNCKSETSIKDFSSHSVYIATERFRKQSECSLESTDSESFIVFDNPDPDDEKINEECLSIGLCNSDSEESVDGGGDNYDDEDDDGEVDGDGKHGIEDFEGDDTDDDYECVDYNCCNLDLFTECKELVEANDKWLRNYKDVETKDNEKTRKVKFSNDVKVNKIVAWDFAYRAARSGPWEQMARDRVRFRERILQLSAIVSPVLLKEHRDKVYKELYS